MWCPKCYGGMKKKEGFCPHCGFKLKDFEGATNGKIRIARANGVKDDILYTTDIPIDVSKKKLLLLCIFLGFMGAHNYYVGKFGRAIYSTVTFVVWTTIVILMISGVTSWVLKNFTSLFALLFGVSMVIWIFDLINIITKKFKIPVYKEEFSIKD